jgi:hypothetical protein
MSDNTQLNLASTSGDIISTDQLADSSKVQNIKNAFGVKDQMIQVNSANPLPVQDSPNTQILVLAELRVISALLKEISNVRDDIDTMRADELNNIKSLIN